MNDAKSKVLGAFTWFHWVVLISFGILVGLLSVIVIILKPHPAGLSSERQVQDKVAKLVLLPTDETPALATIIDPTKLQNNSLLVHTQKGDKVLIYAKWKQAVVYRPSINKIIDIGPVDVSAPSGDTSGYQPLQ